MSTKRTIKLFKKSTLSDGTVRLQSQLLVGQDACDYSLRPNGELCIYRHGENSFGFYPISINYEIVENETEMSVTIM